MSNRVTKLVVDTNAFLDNINNIKKFVGNKEIMPIIKANGYGTHINKRIDIINNFNIVGVAIVDEAIDLRNNGYNNDIFVLNQPSILELDDISKYDLIVGISEISFIKNINVPIRAHLEIETGMNRTGIKIDDLEEVINIIKNNPNIKVEGIYTHLSSADNDNIYTMNQINRFRDALKIVREHFDLKYIHCSASNGLLKYINEFTNLVRPGIIIYGYESFPGSSEIIDIKPICKLKTAITYLKEVEAGESISYSRKFISNKKMKVATIPIGYADGFRRTNTNIGEVIVKGVKCKVLGSVCMDSCMIDVTDIDVKVGDTVYIFDNDIITLDDIANRYNTINYEVLCTLSDRIPREFI